MDMLCGWVYANCFSLNKAMHNDTKLIRKEKRNFMTCFQMSNKNTVEWNARVSFACYCYKKYLVHSETYGLLFNNGVYECATEELDLCIHHKFHFID